MANLNDTAIIEQVLRGDTEAFGTLVGRYSDKVFSLVFRICGNRQDAEEATQDAFVKAYAGLSRFRAESSFSSWIYRIAYNTAISRLRREKGAMSMRLYDDRLNHRAETDSAFSDGFDGEPFGRLSGDTSGEEPLERLEKALEKLMPEDRTLLFLFYREEKPVREIASIVSQSEGNVKIRLHRARKRLAAIYEKL